MTEPSLWPLNTLFSVWKLCALYRKFMSLVFQNREKEFAISPLQTGKSHPRRHVFWWKGLWLLCGDSYRAAWVCTDPITPVQISHQNVETWGQVLSTGIPSLGHSFPPPCSAHVTPYTATHRCTQAALLVYLSHMNMACQFWRWFWF